MRIFLALRRFVRRHLLRWRIWETEQAIADGERWLAQTSAVMPKLRAQLVTLQSDARINEIQSVARYRVRSAFDFLRRQP